MQRRVGVQQEAGMNNRVRFQRLLPIGSVVNLGDYEKRLMIVGRGVGAPGEDHLHDYCSVPFPEGYEDGDHLIIHDHSDISSITRIGYINDGEMELAELIEKELRAQDTK